jgi:hypothetical protein
MKRFMLKKFALVGGLILIFWLVGIPWMKEQAYLWRSRPAPVLAEQRITPENASRVKLLETWEEGEALSPAYTLGEITWLKPQEGRLLAWRNETLVLVAFPEGELLHTWQADLPVDGAAWEAHFSLDGRFIAAQYGNRVRSFDARSGQALGPWLNASERFAIAPDGTRLAWAGTLSLSEDPSRVGVYRTQDGKKLALFKTRAFYWRDLSYSPDGKLLVALGDDGQLTYAWIGRTPVFRWLEPAGYRAAFSPDGLILATPETVLSLRTHKKLALEYPLLAGTPFALAFSPAGDLLVTQTVEGGLYLWRVSDGSLLGAHRLPEGIAQIAFSPDGDWFSVLIQGAVYRYGLEN